MNLMSSVQHFFVCRDHGHRAQPEHEPLSALAVVVALVLALLGTAAALWRGLDDDQASMPVPIASHAIVARPTAWSGAPRA